MRTIKFRGYIPPYLTMKGRWVYGLLARYNDELATIVSNDKLYTVPSNTIGQFTGLHDKNDVEIYEGDKLVITQSFQVLDGEVIYHEDTACYRLKIDEDEQEVLWYLPKEMVVIGNIHDKEELK